ncbi:hypothetical protein ACFV98_21000 [Streptomyces violascens]|uniref:hypothetical protein n=1 Tax=Streptomyces violascens TaxID=67381 RepID=UPI00364C3545
MSEGIAWIGDRKYDARADGAGMLEGISLTLARGVEPEEFLLRLGADEDQLLCGDLYRERHELDIPQPRPGPVTQDNPQFNCGMYGTCGEWVYALEDWGVATWFMGYHSTMAPLVGEEWICISVDRHVGPNLILHAPGLAVPGEDGRTYQAEFGSDTDRSSALDAALEAVGAVYPSQYNGGVSTEQEQMTYWEEHREELPARVFTAVGQYCDVSIDQAMVEAGDLPLIILPMPQTY